MEKFRDIKANSLNALNFFVLYICAQDKKISAEELENSCSNIISAALNGFDYFGSVKIKEIKSIASETSKLIVGNKKLLYKKIFNDEKNLISKMLFDEEIIHIALLIARIAASADGLAENENKKLSYWSNYWDNKI